MALVMIMKRLRTDVIVAIGVLAILLLAMAVVGWIGYDRWTSASECPCAARVEAGSSPPPPMANVTFPSTSPMPAARRLNVVESVVRCLQDRKSSGGLFEVQPILPLEFSL